MNTSYLENNYITIDDINKLFTLYKKYTNKEKSKLICGSKTWEDIKNFTYIGMPETKNGLDLVHKIFNCDIEINNEIYYLWIK